jgi:Mrp family chromosome partitioning ATPase
MSNCSHNCSSCSQSDCKDRNQFEIKAKDGVSFKKTIAVMSGKGGVGKSLITSLLAVESKKRGLEVAVLDADITGPSIPKTFGVDHLRAQGSEEGLYPVYSNGGDTIFLMDQIGSNESDGDWIDEISMKQAIKKLPPREKRILSMRFMKGMTQTEVANEIGISQAQVSRLEKSAINTIKGE